MRLARASAGRVALSLAVVLYIALAVGSGLDRLSEQTPALERLVPRPFRAHAERSAATLAAYRNERRPMLAHAQAAVLRDPVNPGSASLLGATYLLRGDAPAAERAFRVAARFGWRDVPTQAYWFEAAMEAGEVEPAADRLDALLRAHPGMQGSDEMIAWLERAPGGQAALQRKLAGRPSWLLNYVQAGGVSADELNRRGAVLAGLAKEGTRLGCDVIAPFVTTALAAGARAQAERAWLGHCPSAKLAGVLADGGFDRFGLAGAAPFGWALEPSGDVAVEAIGTGAARQLRLANRASVSRLVLVQPVALAAGRYRVRAQTQPLRLAASFGCGKPPALPSGVMGDIATDGQVIDLPVCGRLTLGLWLRGSVEGVTLDNVRIERAR